MDTTENEAPSCYAVLGVDETATQEQIRTAYRALVKATHPDAGGDPARFDAVSKAYAILRDPDLRAQYDQQWKYYSAHADFAKFVQESQEDLRRQAQEEAAAQQAEAVRAEEMAAHVAEQQKPRGVFGEDSTPPGYWRPQARWTATFPATCRLCAHTTPQTTRPRPPWEWGRVGVIFAIIATMTFLAQAIFVSATGAAVDTTIWNWMGAAIEALVVAVIATPLWWRRLWWRQASWLEFLLWGPLCFFALAFLLQGWFVAALGFPLSYLLLVRFTRKRTERPPVPCGPCRFRYRADKSARAAATSEPRDEATVS